MDERSSLTFLMRLLGAAEVNQQARETASNVSKLGTETQTAGERAAAGASGWSRLRQQLGETDAKAKLAKFSVGGLVKHAAALGVGYGALQGLHSAVDVTTELGETSLKLNKIQGLNIRQGADLAAVAHVRGLATGKLAQATGILSRNVGQAVAQWNQHNTAVSTASDVEGKLAALRDRTNRSLMTLGVSAADQVKRQLLMEEYRAKRQQIITTANVKAHNLQAKGAGTAAGAFKALGFTQNELAHSSGNMFPLLLKLNDAFNKLPGGAKKTQLALQIFGRGGIGGLLPLFREGPLGLRDSLQQADQTIGAFFSGGIKNTEDLLIAQQRAKFATLGLQLAMGQFLLPIIAKVSNAWAHLVDAVHRGAGPWGVIKDVVGGVVAVLRPVVDWFSRSKMAADVLGVALVGLGAAWGVEKVIGFVTAIGKLKAISGILGMLNGLRASLFGVAAGEEAVTAAQSGGLGNWARFGSLIGRTLGVAAGSALIFYLGDQIKNFVSTGLMRVLSAPTDATIAADRDPAVRRARTQGHALHNQIAAFDRAHPALTGPVSPTVANLRRRLRLGDPGLVPGNPGIPRNYRPGHPYHGRLPGLRLGGVVTGAGSWVTGEAGPELNTLRGNQVRVQPLTSGGGGGGGPRLGNLTEMIREGVIRALEGLQSPVYLDGRELAASTVRWQLSAAGRA